jgi:hypothetical protein
MAIQTQTRRLLLPILAALLTACGAGGQQPASTPVPIAPSQPPVATATSTEAPALAAPTATVALPAALAATDAPPLPSPSAPIVPALPLYNGITHGVTPNGFFFLGDPDAPVTLTDYSDFL